MFRCRVQPRFRLHKHQKIKNRCMIIYSVAQMTIWRKLFGKYLLVTNTVSCGLMMAAADMIQQRSEHWKKNNGLPGGSRVLAASLEDQERKLNASSSDIYMHDYIRTKNMTTVGLVQGPFHHWFYLVLDKVIPGRTALSVVKKTCLDQTIASPTCLGIFFIGLGVLEHHKIEEIYEELKVKLYDTWKVDCCFWPPTQCVNFIFVPFRYRVLYTNFMTMIYDIFLSYMKYDHQYD
ncbi:PREDICTED: mpv17-like protein 2 [Dufourea novaeangliae]|uniref:mpv17-like protein 2 n=1 Tax=Dufourea novaeangliae TaxID=178035 RepID=UPI00076765A9|nr:PREDICTED: mpv17-like protein 2 [Dufourea novaeangliae]